MVATRRFLRQLLVFLLLISFPISSVASERRLDPAYEEPEYVTWLLQTAREEIGYTEGEHGYTKYGEWAGDPYAQWCAEFLCWCVSQVDQEHGTELLRNVYPMYSSSNVGRTFFIDKGRYIVRWGNLEGWGYQWLKGETSFLSTGDYIPQPGDWVFFTWTSDLNTDHVAMVEYCTIDDAGEVTVHVIEGNTPDQVRRETYSLKNTRILGFGTVHDAADWTMRSGNVGEKVRQLQDKLAMLGYLSSDMADGRFGPTTQAAVMAFQTDHGIRPNGIANITTQTALDKECRISINNDPATWRVDDDPSDDTLDFSFDDMFQDMEPKEEEELDYLWDEDVVLEEEETEDVLTTSQEDLPEEVQLEDDILDTAPDW